MHDKLVLESSHCARRRVARGGRARVGASGGGGKAHDDDDDDDDDAHATQATLLTYLDSAGSLHVLAQIAEREKADS